MIPKLNDDRDILSTDFAIFDNSSFIPCWIQGLFLNLAGPRRQESVFDFQIRISQAVRVLSFRDSSGVDGDPQIELAFLRSRSLLKPTTLSESKRYQRCVSRTYSGASGTPPRGLVKHVVDIHPGDA